MRFPFSARVAPSRRIEANRLPQRDGDAVDLDGAAPRNEGAIGELLRETRDLSDAQIEQIVSYQQRHGLQFGDAAVALKLATRDDVLWALSRQFQYAYAGSGAGHHHDELVMAGNPFGEQAEAFRELRSQLLMGVLAPEEPRRALAVVSPDSGDGKTFVAANLAVAFSQLGGHTLLVDVDMRTPRQHRLFGMENRSGLSNILSGRAEPHIIRPVKDLPSLYVLPAGSVPPNPLELVQRPAFGVLIHELLAKFDHVVVDTPANIHGADARVVAAKCGAALAIGRRGSSRLQSMQILVNALAKGPAVLAGVVMNER